MNLTLQEIAIILQLIARAPCKGSEAKAVAVVQHKLTEMGNALAEPVESDANWDEEPDGND